MIRKSEQAILRAQFGQLPKHDPQSARAWLYGKLLMSRLGQKLTRMGRDIAPWGYSLSETAPAQRLERVRFSVASGAGSH